MRLNAIFLDFLFFVIFLLFKALGERVRGVVYFRRKGDASPLNFQPVRPMLWPRVFTAALKTTCDRAGDCMLRKSDQGDDQEYDNSIQDQVGGC
jgi:hypothetical protein